MVDGTTTDATEPAAIWPEFMARLPATLPITVVRNKADITGETLGLTKVNGHSLIRLSARTGEGIDLLRDHLKQVWALPATLKAVSWLDVAIYRHWRLRQAFDTRP